MQRCYIMSDQTTLLEERNKLRSSLLMALFFVFALWFIRVMELSFGTSLVKLGILPRHMSGLVGIVTSPLIHGTTKEGLYSHIIHNSLVLIPILGLTLYSYRQIAFKVIAWLWLMIGFWVWCFARENYHVGASGLAYGLASFLFFIGIFQRKPSAMALSGIILVTHSGMLYGIFPKDPHVSWESHLIGLIAGMVVAFYFRNSGLNLEPKYSWMKEGNTSESFDFTYTYEDRADQREDIQFRYDYRPKKEGKK